MGGTLAQRRDSLRVLVAAGPAGPTPRASAVLPRHLGEGQVLPRRGLPRPLRAGLRCGALDGDNPRPMGNDGGVARLLVEMSRSEMTGKGL